MLIKLPRQLVYSKSQITFVRLILYEKANKDGPGFTDSVNTRGEKSWKRRHKVSFVGGV